VSVDTIATKEVRIWVRGAPAPPVEDEYHNPIPGEAELAGAVWPGTLAPKPGAEVTTGQQTTVSRFLLVIFPNEYGELPAVEAIDRVQVDGQRLEFSGPPLLYERPGGRPHHIEAEVEVLK